MYLDPKDQSCTQPHPLSITQPLAKGNHCIWVHKDQTQLIHPTPQVFKPIAPNDKDKEVIQCPPPSSETTKISTPLHSKSTLMEIRGPSTVSVSQTDEDNTVLVFPPPRPRVIANQDHLKLKEIDAQKTTSSSIISPRIQLSQATEILKCHIQPPQWWINRFSSFQSPKMNI